ncbi:alkaline phosphatase [Ulvibacter antarcticus]|uniref:Alkaline phosphatase n=1 Tax=Ulvibacter antarcticus TaxID=442714 RepID=A0A3L9YRP0_9FLAO|nr:alkaline phosphatase [Ulvibacter antarcticus]RMA57132.1 alkaline phosphatase [Ulvibacter antarcticus]
MKFKFTVVFPILFLFFTSVSCVTAQRTENVVSTVTSQTKLPLTKPKNIILLIGDGMGLSEVSASLFYNENKSNFERFTTIGLSKTSSSNELVTDSASGATALSAGVKTYNGAIGVSKDTIAVETILENVAERGLATGLIATSSIVHATPASFYAHVKRRSLYNDIALALPNSKVDFIAGGGLKFFNMRPDGKNLLQEFENNGFEVNTTELPSEISEKKQAIILAENSMPKMTEGRGDFLPNATALGLKKLSKNPNGFFIMIEGSQIDWGGHDNDAEYLIAELIDFDKAIGVALDFAKNDGETLVIVTADHETGGFTLAADGMDYNKIVPTFSTGGHSATMVPVFAIGPGAALFGGVYENTEIYHKMMTLLSK